MNFSAFPDFEGFEDMFSDKADKSFEPLHMQQTQQQNEILLQDMRNFMQSAVNEDTVANDQLQPVAMGKAIKSIESLHAQMEIAVHEFQPQAEQIRPSFQDLPLQEDLQNQMQFQDQYWQPDLQLRTQMEDHAHVPIQHQIQAQAQMQLYSQPSTVQQPNQVLLKIQNRDVHREQPTLQSHLELELQKIRAGSGDIQSQVGAWQPQVLPAKQDSSWDARMDPNSQFRGPQILDIETSMESIPSLQPQIGMLSRPFRFQPLNTQREEVEIDEIQPNTAPKQTKTHEARRRDGHYTDLNPPKRRRVTNKRTNKKNRHGLDGSQLLSTPPRFGSATNVSIFDALRTTSVKGQVKCAQCDELFADMGAMDRHFRRVHLNPGKKLHICEECQQPCRSEPNLLRHWNNVHTGELDFLCDACGARFSTKRSLSMHRTKLHPDTYQPRPKRKKITFRECKLCDYSSDQSYAVIRHFFTKHTDAVAMECLNGCGITFKSMSNAKVHLYNCKHIPSKSE